jgi:polyhydroxybutyrate depolymerase
VHTYEGCSADVVFYRIDGGGHSWPGASADVPLGSTTRTIDANELIVDFFEAH